MIKGIINGSTSNLFRFQSRDFRHALMGNQEDNYLVFHTIDSEHIKILSNLTTDAWLKNRKI